MTTKSFDIAAVLAVTTGIMLTDFDKLSETIRWAVDTDEDLASIGVVIMGPVARNVILAQHPDLPTEVAGDPASFVSEQRRQRGDALMITRG